jgi:hypothetical protein
MPILSADVDLDFADRNAILSHIEHTPAALENGERHNSGVYVTAIPQNILMGTASIDYKKAEEIGYVKLDILNNHIYSLVESQEHLEDLLSRPIHWNRLQDGAFTKNLVHIGNYSSMIQRLQEPIDSIEKLAMFLAIIRPGKKHLQGKSWSEIEKTVWDRNVDGFTFKKAHALAYATLVILHMAILESISSAGQPL